MSNNPSLDKLVLVSPRFARSISLARDAHRADALDGYILTPTGRDVLRRLTDALHGKTSTRAWSLTGPYGSGKSAFALLVGQALAGEQMARFKARAYLTLQDEQLASRLFGAGAPFQKQEARLCPVLVTGSRQPLEKALAASLAVSLRTIAGRGRPPQIIDRLEQIANQTASSGTAIVGLFEEANEYLERFGNEASGILLVIDELGKFLEYGATNPDQGDVFVLQELAESASRSKRPFLFLTILHQAIDRYADHMSPGRRAEWAKVQGRFEDVPFEERTEQILRLLAHAIKYQGEEAERKALRRTGKSLAQDTVNLGIRSGSMAKADLQECLAECYPLHPLTTLVLAPLFRQVAQNERSLFAFLSSSELFGFQDFLREETARNKPYRLDRLYDYVMASLGPTLFAQHRGKLWAEVQSALDRLHNATDLELAVAKTIGILQSLGNSTGVPASACVLQIALKGVATEEAIEEAIKTLRGRSVVVFRRHTGSYALWEGSDIDIEDRLQAARQSVEREQSLAAFLVRQFPPQPVIARRHYFQTGTLRYFDACYFDRSASQGTLFEDTFSSVSPESDGRIVFCLPRDSADREMMRGLILTAAQNPVVVALPHDLYDLREYCHELTCLRWVMEHTPELEADRVARREFHARLAIAEENLRTHLEWLFSPANASGCEWYYGGEAVPLRLQRDLNDLISRACDDTYSATPHWRNELINRRSLSSSAAAARRNLIEAMLEHPTAENLGFSGNPPERSMYETLLKESRLHREQSGAYGFYPPDADAAPAVQELWKTIDSFLDETENGKKSVEDFFIRLRQPPFGLKDGILPVLLAMVLVHAHSEVALYEEGSFVPRPKAAVFERIFRSPAKYELQRFRITGPRAKVFQQYAAILTRAGSEPDLLGIVRPLVKVVKELPDYVGKTKQLSETAQKILRAVKDARQPDRLLFTDLPAACEHSAFQPRGVGQTGCRPNEKTETKQIRPSFPDLRSSIF